MGENEGGRRHLALIKGGSRAGRRGRARTEARLKPGHNTPVFLQLLPHLLLPRHLLFLLWRCSVLPEGSSPVPLPPSSAGLLCRASLRFPQLLSASPALCLLPPGRPRPRAAPGPLLLSRRGSAPAWHVLGFVSPLPRGSPPGPVTCRGRE